jgi:hypothetical protein
VESLDPAYSGILGVAGGYGVISDAVEMAYE